MCSLSLLCLAASLRGPPRIESLTLGIYPPSRKFYLLLEQARVQGNFRAISDALEIAEKGENFCNPVDAGNKWSTIFTEIRAVMIDTDMYHLTIITEDEKVLIREGFDSIWNSNQFARVQIIRTPCGNIRDERRIEDELWEEVQVVRYAELEEIFKGWLLDQSPNQNEHVRIYFPTSIFSSESLVLLCDTYARHINPFSLPAQLSSSLLLQSEPGQIYIGSSKNSKIPVYELRVTARVAHSGICQSLIYDAQGISLKPTQSFRVECAAQNDRRFQCLCKLARTKNEVYLAESSLDGLFVLIPGLDDLSFLLKSLVTKDLLLPIPQSAHPSHELVDIDGIEVEMGSSFDKIKVIEYYDPLLSNSNLLEVIESHVIKKVKR